MGELGSTPTVGEIAVVADAMEAVGQDLSNKTALAMVLSLSRARRKAGPGSTALTSCQN
jgi:hypothetical protein